MKLGQKQFSTNQLGSVCRIALLAPQLCSPEHCWNCNSAYQPISGEQNFSSSLGAGEHNFNSSTAFLGTKAELELKFCPRLLLKFCSPELLW
jgi:hypothetical protein